jgi:hypothetical protein
MPAFKKKKTVWVCTCLLPGCPGRDPKTGKPRPWESKDATLPTRCNWCKRYTWNHEDQRYTANRPGTGGKLTLPKPHQVRSLES